MRAILALPSLLFAIVAVAADAPTHTPYQIPEHFLAGEARGPYRTGTVEELWIDPQRGEPTTSDPTDKRHLMVQIWYPAAFEGDPERAAYVLHRDLYPHTEEEGWLDAVATVRTTSVLGAPLAAAPRPFPVLIYNPGGGHPPFSGTFQTEFLASHGYVVVAVGHTGLTQIERFPDGYVYKPDRNSAELTDAESKDLSPMQSFEASWHLFAERMMPEQVRDISFVLDRLTELNASRGNRLYGRLDLDHVGSLGWSLGGALSFQASRDEPRIKAAANMDGWLYTDVANTGTHRPLLLLHEDQLEAQPPEPGSTPADREIELHGNSLFWRMFSKCAGDWYHVTIGGTGHGHFSDRVLFDSFDPTQRYPREAHEIINAFTLEFFDRYLRAQADTPLLDGKLHFRDTRMIKRPTP